ncbi:hypothetical protein LTS15_010097 [Exophiala xenobiotica]|nr:hypothetical protein LTS15_010097 [Exophiala xenobiotica]
MAAPATPGLSGLKVLIAGGSIGGLATAIALRAQGHSVTIYEQAFTPETMGAGITIFPNSVKALEMLGIDTKPVQATRITKITRAQIEDDGVSDTLESDLDAQAWPWHQTTYSDLFVALWESVHDNSKPGPKIEIITSKSVCRVDTAKAMLYFSNGSHAVGDVVIGADGVHSVCRSFVPGGSLQRFRIKRHVFRALIPRERLEKDPLTAKFVGEAGHAHCYNHNDKSLLITPASNGKNVCVKFLYEDRTAFQNLSKDWRDPSSKRKLLRMTGGLPEECVALFGKISDRDLQDQPIWDMDPLTTFQSQRMALMGDAAHPMPPYCGQRIAMALEDALALGVILEPDTPVGEIEDRLKLYSRTRKQRAEAVQQTTRGLSEADMRNFATDFDTASFHTYILEHNEREHMGQALSAWKKHRSLNQRLSDSSEQSQQSMESFEKPLQTSQRRSPSPKKWWSLGRKGSSALARVFHTRQTPVAVAAT